MKITHKFRAKPQNYQGIHFASKKEAKRYSDLLRLKEAGEILFFLRQVPLHLPGSVKYVCDFLIFWQNGNVTFEDVKGMKTPLYIAKKKMVEDIYPIEIQEI